MAAIVTIQCSQTGVSHPQQLVEGMLDWESVKKAFQAEVVELEDSGIPSLHRQGNWTGLTRQIFAPNDVIKVKVTKRGEHESTAIGSRTCPSFFRGCQHALASLLGWLVCYSCLLAQHDVDAFL